MPDIELRFAALLCADRRADDELGARSKEEFNDRCRPYLRLEPRKSAHQLITAVALTSA